MKRTQRTQERGFTLIEALIAIVILAFGLLAVVTLIDVSYSAMYLSKNTTKATQLAAYMRDRILFESSSTKQAIMSRRANVSSFDNDASANIIMDTNSTSDPATEPGMTACREWRSLIKDPVRGLADGQGIVTITLDDASKAGNHTVVVEVFWGTTPASPTTTGLLYFHLKRSVRLEMPLTVGD